MHLRSTALVILVLLEASAGLALEPEKRLTQYVRATWTADRGLPQNSVFGVTQTTDGYIWIATQEGFVRFDGSQFVTYDRRSYPQIASAFATSIHALRDGSLGVGTFGGGLIRMRGEQIEVLTETNGLPSSDVQALHESSDGTLWIGTSSGLARLSNGRITPFPSEKLPHVTITALAEDTSGRLWIGTAGGLVTLKDGRVTAHGPAEGFPLERVESFGTGRDGSVWVGMESGGLLRYRSGEVSAVSDRALDGVRVTAIHEDRRGTLWIGTHDRGFARLLGGRVEFDTETRHPVSSFFEDREANLWIGRIGGLDRLADGVVITFSKSEGLLDNDVKSVAADASGRVWVGTRLGVDRLTGTERFSKGSGLSSSYVLSTWPARDGSLWIGTADSGLNRVQGRRISTYTVKDGLPADAVLALFEDRRGGIWAGTSAGLARLVDGKIEAGAVPQSFSGESISAIAEDRHGSMWIGTHEHGLTRISGGRAESFTTKNGLSNDLVVSIHEDAAGTLWVGTAEGGLNRYKDGKFSAVTSQHGLQDDTIFAILEDDRGNLWMSSNKGIFRASLAELNAVADGTRRTLQSVIYGRSDGMKSRECNGGTQPVAWKTPDGRLWFATTGGVAMIDPAKALVPGPATPVLIGTVYAGQDKIAQGAPVPPGHRTLEIHYTSTTFRAPDKLRFQYMLEGFDAGWTDAQTRRIAYYTNVPPGRYRFHVRVTNGEGITSPASTIPMVVEPFFYQTPLFWVLVAISILAAAWTAHQWRVRLIRASAERFKVLFDRNLAGVYRARIDGRILDCNQAGLRILGYSSVEEMNDRSIFDAYVTPSDAGELIRRLRADRAVSGIETALRRTDGTPIWVLQNVSLGRSEGEEILEATLIDLTDRRRAEEQIRYQAYHDTLTDLPNRVLFKERLALAVAHGQRRGRQVAVLFLDLDRFKLINDTLGHTVGDHLLQGMATRLKACVREEDSVARVGGDEFTILLMDLHRPGDATVVAQKILEEVARPMTVDGHELYTTCSIGISMSPADGIDAETLLKNADNALYRAKEAGKNNYQLCTPSMTQLAAERLALESALRQALDRHEFLVLYQPQYDLRSGRVVAVEALLRWDRPGGGIVGPSHFIAAAEESRLIVPIGELVLETAAKDWNAWAQESRVRIAVNVSAAQFRQRHLVGTIRNALRDFSLDPTQLEIEITESTAMHNPAATAEILEELKELGVSIVIDDFGIGHSSLNYLKRFPIDGLKIDRTFVQDMTADASDAAIVAAIIAMAEALNLRVIAEGVETEQQLAFLQAHGCSVIQGYLISRPVSAETIREILRSGAGISIPALPHTA
ncbi:MAG TPA: EAL domain-containing protein [Thermoanaerobaculia bacterium]|nr:EAL domain-containing protein [Thermoanaerobaculia bacterium]